MREPTKIIVFDGCIPNRVRVQGDLFHGVVPHGAVYVGRPAPGLPASRYYNPFPVKQYGLVGSLTKFVKYVGESPTLVELARKELLGKDLACWCALPAPGEVDMCHAGIWIALANHSRTRMLNAVTALIQQMGLYDMPWPGAEEEHS